MFRFDNTIKESALKIEVSTFTETIGFRGLDTRVSKLDKWMRQNPFANDLLADKHKLEFSIWKSIKALRTYGRLPPIDELPYSRAYAFVVVFNRVYSAISPRARNRLLGSVANAFNDESDLRSLEHELKCIGHFVNLDCEVECHDLENGGFDILCLRSGIEFEVECKTISVNKGRQIHQYDLLRLSDHLHRDIISLATQPDGFGTLVSVTLPARLVRAPVTLKKLAADVEKAFRLSESLKTDEWEISSQRFLVSNSPFDTPGAFDKESVQGFVKRMVPNSIGQMLVNARAGRRAAILDIHSTKADQYPEQIYQALKEGATQFSKGKPAVLVAAVLDLASKDLEVTIGDPLLEGFQGIASRLFSRDSRSYLHTVMFAGDAILRRGRHGSASSTGKTLNFQNPNHPLRMDSRLRFTFDWTDV